MNIMHKLLYVLAAVALAALALPSAADNGKKMYSLQMQITPPGQTTAPFTLGATITNEGNSTINSFILYVSGLTIVGVNQPSTGKASFTGTSVSVTGMHPLKSGQSLAVTLQVGSCGDGMWSAAAWTGSSLNGQTFNLVPGDSSLETFISCGNLGSGAAFTVPDIINPSGCIMGSRGFYDKDGSIPGSPLPYYVTNTVPTNGQLHFRWPVSPGDPLATFEYTVCAPDPQPPAGVLQVAWLTDNSGNPLFITAQDCIPPVNLPAPYGTLTADLYSGDTVIPIDTTTLGPSAMPGVAPGSIPYPVPPLTKFDIVIGTERITVKLVCGDNDEDPTDPNDCTEDEGPNTLNVVQRGVGGTTIPDVHSAPLLVMSTPLPLVPANTGPYLAGNQAQMCIANETPVFAPGFHSTTFIDIGDGWANHP